MAEKAWVAVGLFLGAAVLAALGAALLREVVEEIC